MKELYSGQCDFTVFENVSKNGNTYQAIKIKIGDYEVSQYILLNNEKMYCIKKAIQELEK